MWTSGVERWRVYNLRRPIAPNFVHQQQQQPNRAINIQIETKLDEGSTKPLKVLLKSNFNIEMVVTIDQGPHDGPDMIIPPNEASPKRSFGEHISHIFKAFTTRNGLVGDYDYGEDPAYGL
jgi:hypothetical protein